MPRSPDPRTRDHHCGLRRDRRGRPRGGGGAARQGAPRRCADDRSQLHGHPQHGSVGPAERDVCAGRSVAGTRVDLHPERGARPGAAGRGAAHRPRRRVVCVYRQQGRCVGQRSAAGLGRRPRHRRRPDVHRELRQPAQVRRDCSPHGPPQADRRAEGGQDTGRPSRSQLPHGRPGDRRRRRGRAAAPERGRPRSHARGVVRHGCGLRARAPSARPSRGNPDQRRRRRHPGGRCLRDRRPRGRRARRGHGHAPEGVPARRSEHGEPRGHARVSVARGLRPRHRSDAGGLRPRQPHRRLRAARAQRSRGGRHRDSQRGRRSEVFEAGDRELRHERHGDALGRSTAHVRVPGTRRDGAGTHDVVRRMATASCLGGGGGPAGGARTAGRAVGTGAGTRRRLALPERRRSAPASHRPVALTRSALPDRLGGRAGGDHTRLSRRAQGRRAEHPAQVRRGRCRAEPGGRQRGRGDVRGAREDARAGDDRSTRPGNGARCAGVSRRRHRRSSVRSRRRTRRGRHAR